MTFSFVFVSSQQLGGLEPRGHLPAPRPASGRGCLPPAPGARGSSGHGDRAPGELLRAVCPPHPITHGFRCFFLLLLLCCFIFFFPLLLFSLIVGGVYEAVCQNTIDSREPAYTKRVCRQGQAGQPWKPPPLCIRPGEANALWTASESRRDPRGSPTPPCKRALSAHTGPCRLPRAPRSRAEGWRSPDTVRAPSTTKHPENA